jgi:Gluconate 2-dehydrogenase subunit 3
MEDKDKDETRSNSEKKGGVSRRKWLIDLGKTAALAGIAGKAGPLEADGLAWPAAPESKPENLPPGLYRPSSGHLGRALENDSRFHATPPGSEVDFIRPSSGPFEPQFFSPGGYKVIHRLTALVLGESATASLENNETREGNIVDEVAEWVDLHAYSFASVREAAERLTEEQVALAKAYNGAPLLQRVKTTDPQKTYRDGLAWIAEESERRHQHEFIDLTEEQQVAILDAISDDRAEKDTENEGTRLFWQLKSDIISGFYTSRTGLKELDYKGNRFYAESPGCLSRDHPHQKTGQ